MTFCLSAVVTKIETSTTPTTLVKMVAKKAEDAFREQVELAVGMPDSCCSYERLGIS